MSGGKTGAGAGDPVGGDEWMDSSVNKGRTGGSMIEELVEISTVREREMEVSSGAEG